MSTRDDIHVAVCCDDNYAPHLGVVLCSMLMNSSEPRRLVINLVDVGITPANVDKLRGLVERHGARLNPIVPDSATYAGLPVFRYGPAVYQRISLPQLLDPTVERVVYIDCDTVVLGDIVELWNTPLEGYALAAAENLSPSAHRDIDLPRQAYFNSGVMVIDLREWRARHLSERIVQFITEHADRLRFVDQCGMNGVFRGNWKRLPLAWNQQSDIYSVYAKYMNGCSYTRSDFLEAMEQPKIVHYIGKRKPWLINCFHPFKIFYKAYLAKTPWAGMQPSDATLGTRLRSWLSARQHLKRSRRQRRIKLKLPA